ncbi:carbohydrate ABC transporter permease [Amphibacillus cookii]|uniref:carbohydrate ABC transporter permease n=1 Tax=Amphibacillus cookii TaxID=767787 RepID=UPI001957F166|nr:sugar ABC transporter permease [Amphibacillus cookii]MBM7541201.1 raffinose/stachyose/melibiose transport system permease protein [Amphibacillus cookii]
MYYEKRISERLKVFGLFGFIPLLVFFLVMIVPFVIGILMTVTTWTGLTGSLFEFIGFENFISAFSDPNFGSSLIATFKYVVFTLVLTNVLGFGLALLVTQGRKGQEFFKLSFFTPNLIGGIILGFIWQFIFSRAFVSVGVELGWGIFSVSWLANPETALWTLIIVSVWQSSGYMMLIYIAGLMGIDKSLMEASLLDGASAFKQLIKVKIPLMIPSFTISLFLTLQRSFLVYDTNLSLTDGGPFRSTELIAMHIYQEAFTYQRFGEGQAKALVLFVIVALIAITQVGIMKKMEVEA